jgi:hypothetical protein
VRFAGLKVILFWDIMPCYLVDISTVRAASFFIAFYPDGGAQGGYARQRLVAQVPVPATEVQGPTHGLIY